MLQEIIERKRREVARGLDGVSVEALRSYASRTTRSLKAALAKPGARFIMEVKRASPSAGDLCVNADAEAQALAYKGAADAISVLTDGPFFKGSLDDLARVRAVFEGPILAKDFIVDVRQVAEARIHGADAILVILSVLGLEETRAVMREAELLGMDVFVEVHDQEELAQAIALNASLIGINNRDLTSFKTDLKVTERLAPLVPKDRVLIAESGISGRGDVERLSPMVDGFLIGSALMRSSRPAQAARALAFGRVKVCGLTNEEDTLAAADSGATHAGMIFVPGTLRAVLPAAADKIAAAARARGLATAGVFRNAEPNEVAELARFLDLDVIQLHGSEDGLYIDSLRTKVRDGIEIWAASGVGWNPPRPRARADRTLFDTNLNGRFGGSGRTFDWRRLDHELICNGILAGGLNPLNARQAQRTGAWALDVGSGVEAAPGQKDRQKLKSFFDALRPRTRKVLSLCG
jgi:indole-3-glycerol phosphate synthase/phosphoribosylanthranilate isomerase